VTTVAIKDTTIRAPAERIMGKAVRAVTWMSARGFRLLRDLLQLGGLLPLAILFLIWQIVAPDDSPYFPPPSTWREGLSQLWRSGALLPAAGATLLTLSIALVVATILGTLLGLAVGASDRVGAALTPTLEFARVMPPAALVPLATLLIGYGQAMKVTLVVLAAIWPILLNTRTGVRELDPVLLDTARSLRLDKSAVASKVLAPAILPAVLLGARVAAPIALAVTLLVELVTGVNGLGALLALSQRNYQPSRVYALIVISGLFTLLVSRLIAGLEALCIRNRSPR